MTDEELEQELAPHRAWYEEQLSVLELWWAEELSDEIARVAKVIHPLPVSETWITKLKTEYSEITRRHNMRAASLDAELMARTKHIWDRYDAESSSG